MLSAGHESVWVGPVDSFFGGQVSCCCLVDILLDQVTLKALSICLQGGEEVNAAQMSIVGRPGLVTIAVRDTSGQDGLSALKPDSLDLQLLAGEPALLVFSNPPQSSVPTRGVLPALTIQAMDAHGNHVPSCPVFEVCTFV